MEDLSKQIEELKSRMVDVKPLPDEEDFFTSSETLMRYLKARDYDLDEAEKALRATVEWRRVNRPFTTDCKWCHERPGYHSMRQVGFDEMGRPVIYSCFAQATVPKQNTVEDSVAHTTYLIENAKPVMKTGINTWVFIIDCTGMTLPSCSPKLGYGVTQVMANHYPERLGLTICINHNPIFQGVWKAIKVFLHPNTTAKVELIRSKKKIEASFTRHFSPELSSWLSEEILLNKQEPLSLSQRQFWKKPDEEGTHDPRGCPSYVAEYIEPLQKRQKESTKMKIHLPHPNVVDVIEGKLEGQAPPTPDMRGATGLTVPKSNFEDLSDSEEVPVPELEMDEQFQIPKDSKTLHG